MSCGPLPPSKTKPAWGISHMNISDFIHWQTKSCLISITIVHGPLKATECYVTMWTCFPPRWEGSILQKLRNPWNYIFQGHTSRFKINLRNKLPMQFTNSFCNRQQLLPPLCLFFITAKLFLARFFKRKSYMYFMFGNYLRRWGASRETHEKITHH